MTYKGDLRGSRDSRREEAKAEWNSNFSVFPRAASG